MNGFWAEIRYAWRLLAKGGIFTVVAVLSLSIGIGANTAIFSVGSAMLLQRLPYLDAERLVVLRSSSPSRGLTDERSAPANVIDWQAQARSFEAIAAYRWRSVDLTGGERSERLRGLSVTSEFFKVIGAAMIGSGFEDVPRPQYNPEIVLGRGVWERRFRSDPRLAGTRLDVSIINLSRVGPTHFRLAGAPPFFDHAGRCLCGYCVRPVTDRNLRSDRAFRGSTTAGDWNSPRDWRYACEHHRSYAAVRSATSVDWNVRRPGRRVRNHSLVREHALRSTSI